MPCHCVGMLLRLPVLELGGRGLGHHGTQGFLVGVADEMVELVVNDPQFLLDLAQT